MTDARFEDGDEAPLRLIARDADSLAVIAALVQDAVLPASQMTFAKGKRRFALFLNRLRREAPVALAGKPERVQALLVVEEVLAVKSHGITRDADLVLSLLDIRFDAAADGAGRLILTFAGDGALALEVEALGVSLRDVTRPYLAPSGKVPDHG